MKKQTKLGLVLAAAAVLSVSVASLVSAKGWVQNGADWFYVDSNGEYVTDTIQASGNAKFYLGEDGAMQKDYFLEDKDGQSYYFGSNGAMVTNTWVAIESSRVENQGDYVPDNYWYYFQANGKAMKGTSGSPKKTTIDGKKYCFNENGQMATGWINSEGKTINPDDETNPFRDAVYYAGGDNDGVLRAGWVTYYDGYDDGDEWQTDKTNLYFYFNTNNNKKVGVDGATTKKINGKTYAFTSEGMMLSGWDITEGYVTDITSLQDKVVYFSGEDDGHQVKKGWVYAVPASTIDKDAYDDGEEKYMYFGSSGDATRDSFKKVNGKYYCFNPSGIMKTGLVIWAPSGVYTKKTATISETKKYINKLDMDWAEAAEYYKKGILRTGDENNDYIKVYPTGKVYADPAKNIDPKITDNAIAFVKMHYFGEDGARKTGTNNLEFSDDTVQINTTASGDKGSGNFAKKYYSLGVVLKANADIRYGLYNTIIDLEAAEEDGFGQAITAGTATPGTAGMAFGPQMGDRTKKLYETEYAYGLKHGRYVVLTTSGAKQKGNKSAKKDADGNYWLVGTESSSLLGIWSQNVKYQDASFETKSYNGLGTKRAGEKVTLGNDGKLDGMQIALDGTTNTGYKADAIYGQVFEMHAKSTADNNEEYTFKTVDRVGGKWFQADYGDKSNVWIPFGIFDNAGNTCTSHVYEDGTQPINTKAHAYEVTPNDDYFVNCYWVD